MGVGRKYREERHMHLENSLGDYDMTCLFSTGKNQWSTPIHSQKIMNNIASDRKSKIHQFW